MAVETWRLLPTAVHDGATNLATDEAILRLLVGGGPPTLRLYQWDPRCLSIGFLQWARSEVNLGRCAELGIAVVRRASGGRAVLHDRELTYSLIAPLDHPLVRGPVRESYRRISAALAGGLSRLGVPLDPPRPAVKAPAARSARTPSCFDAISDYELSTGGRKLAGSAQVRAAGVLLQHGSIPIEADPSLLRALLYLPPGQDEAALDTRMTCLTEVLGRPVAVDEVAAAVSAGFADTLGAPLVPGRLTPAEEDLARRLADARYRSDSWNLRR